MRVKRIKRKMRGMVLRSGGILLLSWFIYIITTIFVGNLNNSIAVELNKTENAIKQLQIENDSLKVEILKLKNKDRVTDIAEDYGLKYNIDNIVTISE